MTQDTDLRMTPGELLADQIAWTRDKLAAFEAAAEGDSGDAELDAALELRQPIEAIIENPLVLAAPDLLAALRRLTDQHYDDDGVIDLTSASMIVGRDTLGGLQLKGSHIERLEAARAAIAKAEGR